MSELFPDGVDSLTDLPHKLFDAIRSGLIYLSFEELPAEEQPPRRIWRDGEALNSWFEEVQRKRKAQYGGSGGWDQSIEDPVENQAAKDLLVG